MRGWLRINERRQLHAIVENSHDCRHRIQIALHALRVEDLRNDDHIRDRYDVSERVAAAACLCLNVLVALCGLNLQSRNGLTTFSLTLAWWGLPIAAACYLLTLATGWQP